MAHGVNIQEQATGVKPAVQISAGLPVYVGTAPITSADLTNVNKPKLCSSLKEFVDQFGPLSIDFDSWTLHEAAKAHFSVYGVAPIVCINILDPENTDHVATATDQSHQLVSGEVPIQVYGGPDVAQLGVIKGTVVVKKASVTKTLGTDYTLAFDDTGALVVSVKSGGSLGNSDVITITFDYLDPTGVTTADVIGGYSAGAYTGLEVVNQVYPALRLVPGLILAPGFSDRPTVAERMAVIARAINGTFEAEALTDLSSDPGEIATYAAAGAWKTDNGYDSKYQLALWPKAKFGGDVYHLSTVLACVANLVDFDHANVPYASPSNQTVHATSAVLDDGTEVLLEKPQANALNDQGIVTLLNGFNGWRLWGNRTAAYPATTDVKDVFIPIRRMFNWLGNTIVLTTDENVDTPINRRLVDLVMGTLNSFLNSLIAQGALIDGKVEFRKDENPTVDLSNGKVTWHVTLTPPSPAEQMEFTLEYDPSALANLFT